VGKKLQSLGKKFYEDAGCVHKYQTRTRKDSTMYLTCAHCGNILEGERYLIPFTERTTK
jgi:hypothetical protein